MHIHDVDEDNLRMISSYLHDRVSDAIPLLSTPFRSKKKNRTHVSIVTALLGTVLIKLMDNPL